MAKIGLAPYVSGKVRCTPAFSGIGRRSLLEGSKNVQRSDDLETGVLYCDDNLERLSVLPSESVDLIYLDPPFFSNKIYEVIWGDEAEVRSFEDRWEGGIQVYINWMRDRMMEMHRVLKPTGSLYLHCDPNASHYLKVMMDGVFGMSNFKNEVVWGAATLDRPSAGYTEGRTMLSSFTLSPDRTPSTFSTKSFPKHPLISTRTWTNADSTRRYPCW